MYIRSCSVCGSGEPEVQTDYPSYWVECWGCNTRTKKAKSEKIAIKKWNDGEVVKPKW